MPFAANPDEFLAMEAKEAYPPHPEMLSAFRKLFYSPSTPMSAIVKEAAAPIIQNLTEGEKPENLDYDMLWRTLQDAVDQLADYNDKFVEFIVELQKLPDGGHIFARLPGFRQYIAEFGFSMCDWPSTDVDRDAKRKMMINQHSFLAKLSTYGVEAYDHIRKAGFTLKSTCEFAPWENDSFPRIEELYDHLTDKEEWPEFRDSKLELVSVKTLDVAVPAAATWIRHVGHRIYEMEGTFPGDREHLDKTWNVKWTGDKGWSKQRFAFWKERFEWMTTVTALEKSTQRNARECAERMAEIEKGEASAKQCESGSRSDREVA